MSKGANLLLVAIASIQAIVLRVIAATLTDTWAFFQGTVERWTVTPRYLSTSDLVVDHFYLRYSETFTVLCLRIVATISLEDVNEGISRSTNSQV